MTESPFTSKTPSIADREQGLQLATQIACAHTDLKEPGSYALLHAERFAKFLAGATVKQILQEEK